MKAVLLSILILAPVASRAQTYQYLLGQKHRYHLHEWYTEEKSTQTGFMHSSESTDFDVEVEVLNVTDTLTELGVRTGGLSQVCSPNLAYARLVVLSSVHVFVLPNGHVNRVRILQGVPSGYPLQQKTRKAVSAYDAVLNYFRFILPQLPKLDSITNGYRQSAVDTVVVGLDSTFSDKEYRVSVANDTSTNLVLFKQVRAQSTKGNFELPSEWNIELGGIDGFPLKVEATLSGHKDGLFVEQHIKVTPN